MPIEIKELIIRASVQNEAGGARKETPSPHSHSNSNSTREEQIVSRCVEQVMDILRMKNER